MTSINETRIRMLAYQIWESEGCPNGRAERHWEMAHSLAQAEAEDSEQPPASAGTAAAPRSSTRSKRVVGKPVAVNKSGKTRPGKE